MRILLLGEYSNVHATLAEGLRSLGHEVTVASNGDFWKNYPRDINLSRQPGKLGGLKLLAKVYAQLPRWRGYDVVQLINPMFLELKAEWIFHIYRYLRRYNRKVVLCAMGMDWYWVNECTNRKPLRYSDFNIGDQLRTDEPALREQRDWLGTAKEQLNRYIANDCDQIIAGLYENYVCYEPYFKEKAHFIPLPIKMPESDILHPLELRSLATEGTQEPSSLIPHPSALIHQPSSIFIGISKGRSAYKGTDIMLRAAEDVLRAHPDKMKLIKAEGIPFNEYQKLMDGSDAILDQLLRAPPRQRHQPRLPGRTGRHSVRSHFGRFHEILPASDFPLKQPENGQKTCGKSLYYVV